MTNIIQSLKVILLAVTLSFGISYVFAWVPPTATPTNGNSFAPINTSNIDQMKNGNLVLNALGITNTASTSLSVYGGAVFDGNLTLGYEAVGCDASYQGSMRYNSTSKKIEYCDSTSWIELSGSIAATSLPVVNISASPTIIATGQSTTLSWTSGADTCTASGGWSGVKPASNSEAVSPASSVTYTLSCSNSSGGDVGSVAVNVKQWVDTVGEGSYGQSCDNWLSTTGQAGVNGSSPRVTKGGVVYGNHCMYQHMTMFNGGAITEGGYWFYPNSNYVSTFSDSNWKPISVSAACMTGVSVPCLGVGYKTQTRR